jgi:hypothetical protein
MGFIRLCGRNAAIRHRSSRQTIVICLVALLICLIGLAGCGSSSNNAANNTGSNSGSNTGSGSNSGSNTGSGSNSGSNTGSGSNSGTSGCFVTSFVHRGRKSLAAKLPVLTSAARPAAFEPPIPDDVIFNDVRPPGDDLQTQTNWADLGIQKAESNPIELPQASQEATKENLQTESNAVVFTEEDTLVTDDYNSDDASYGVEICNAIARLQNSISNLDNVQLVVNDLQQWAASNNTPSLNDLAKVVQDATNQFNKAFGQCINDLDVTSWILDRIQHLFCLSAPSG